MKKSLILTTSLALIFCLSFTFLPDNNANEAAAEIEKTILKAYIHGAFNELNADAMLEGFHKDFSIYSAKGEEINKYPIATWAESVRKRKSSDEFDPSKNVWDHNFAIVDQTGGSAVVKVELSKGGNLIYTDYLSLLKFDSGWKIVAKVYHRHENS